MKGYIYKITNIINGKSYIGQTRYSIESRWRQHQNSKADTHFSRAIRKYGVDAFKVEELEECDYTDLNAREMFYIAKYNTYFEGYNSTLGNLDTANRAWVVDNYYEEMCHLYQDGLSAYKISTIFNIDKGTVSKILKAAGVRIRDPKIIQIDDDEFKELVYDYNHGYSLKSLAKRYDCSTSGLKEYLLKRGVDLRVKYSILDSESEQQALINDYLDNDTTLRQLLSKYHCEYATFCKILAVHGISRGKKHFKLVNEKSLDVIRLFNDGWAVQKIAKKYKVDKTTVYTLLKSAGFKFEATAPIEFDDKDTEDIIQGYYNGCSVCSLAKRYNCSRKSIEKILVNGGVELRRKSNLLNDKDAQKALIEDYLNSDMSVRQLLSKYHCDESSLIKVLDMYNICHSKQRYVIPESICRDCITLFQSGKTVKQVSKELNVPTSSICNILKRNNINYLTV